MTKALMILLAAAAAWACAGDASPSTTALVRDSAGVRIVEHPTSFAADTWHLATTPSLSIGAEEGANSLDRVEGAHQLSDGRVVVANRGTRQLKYFDSQGNLLHNVAREGEGPGELSWISWSVTCGTDSVYVWDPFLARLSVFGPSGGFARSVNLRLEDNTPPTGDATCDDGMILMQRRVPLPRQAGPRRDRVGLVLFDLDGRLVYDLGEFPGPERYFWANPEGTGGTDGPRPLGKTTVHALGQGRVYVGSADEYELRVLDLDQTLQQLIRRSPSDRRITNTHLETYISARLANVTDPNRRRRDERYWRNMEYPETFPAYAHLLLDAPGNLWVQDFVKPGDSVQTWNVFSPSGEQLATITAPVGLHVYEVGDAYVLGVTRDELDVEYVQLYDLIKSGR